MISRLPFLLAALLTPASLLAQDATWRHTRSFYLLTTPEGASLPDTAREVNFPVLVRLHRDFFDFSQAGPAGEDLRFTAGGKPLAHQIEEWDAAGGQASIWVIVPEVRGNSAQELRLHWGKPGARSASSGASVFNAANGHVCVLHLGEEAEPLRDELGSVLPVDQGTSPAQGRIGKARRFEPGKGINCGEKLTSLPTGAGEHTSQVWFLANAPNALALAWGNEQAQGKVTLRVSSPPHAEVECYFSGANVSGQSALPLGEWVHLVHTYRRGDSRVYVNGKLDGAATRPDAPLAIKSPARLYIGGWYGDYRWSGAIDEVRVSNVVRSPDWIRLEYENQKPLQTLVGWPVEEGTEISVSPPSLVVEEGQGATVTALAGGARKVYWTLERNGARSVVAVDRHHFQLEAGRVEGDTSMALELRAVTADGVRSVTVPITIKEAIPEPVLTLQAPAAWNGRDPIEVVPRIENLEALKARGASTLRARWSVSGGAVLREVAPDRLILRRSQFSGPLTVSVEIDNGGAAARASTSIRVTEPARDPWVERSPGVDEKPEDGQFYSRDDRNEGTLHYNGILDRPADEVFLHVSVDGKTYRTERQKPGVDRRYSFAVKLAPGLFKYSVELGARSGNVDTVLETVGNLICGDAYLIDGQSNALATDTDEESPAETSEWIRSIGGPEAKAENPRAKLWCSPVWKARKGELAELGYWGMELAKRLVESQRVPVFMVNGAVGGTRIDQHQRRPENPTELSTIYGRLLWRVEQAKLTHGIRAILWHQGENDQGADGPTGRYGWETYQQYFVEMAAGWKTDYPNVQHYYVFQIWPDSCSMGGGRGDRLREAQRTLPLLFSNLDVLPTLGIRPPGPCHFPLAGWARIAHLVQPLLERDLHGKAAGSPLTGPNLKRASRPGPGRDEIVLELDQPVLWSDALVDQFYLDDASGKVAGGSVSGNLLKLRLTEPSNASRITYLKETRWSQDRLLLGANGIPALTFCDVPIVSGGTGGQ